MHRGHTVAAALIALLAIPITGCGDDAPAPAPPVMPRVVRPPAPEPSPEFPPETSSLRLLKTVPVRLEPAADADRIGTIAQDTRVRWRRTATGKGCSRPWVEIEPRGWICAEQLEATTRPASGVELPRLAQGEVVPGVYGKVTEAGATMFTLQEPKAPKTTAAGKGKPKPAPPPEPPPPRPEGASEGDPDADPATAAVVVDPLGRKMVAGQPLVGSMNVRRYSEINVAGKDYWKISAKDNQYVLRSAISQHRPSTYQGARLADETGLTLPMALVWPKSGPRAWTYSKPVGGGARRPLYPRTAVPILETATDASGKASSYRVADAEWIAASAVRVAELTEPPALVGEHERWIDVDLDRQILIAYEGRVPVYVTMVSTGLKDTPTTPGIYRMWRKVSETDMNGLSGEDPYSVSTVPWTQFFDPDNDLALHTAYWHDRFGVQKSHGCVNLAPRDARWLYFWSDPQVPPGWTMAAGVVESPGSVVRVRSRAEPTPPWRGYAKQVQERRLAKQPVRP